LNIAEAFTESQLRKNHGEQLVVTSEATVFVIAAVTVYQSMESLAGDQVGNLGKDGASGVHGASGGKTKGQMIPAKSNRGRSKIGEFALI
jgi:hypothetical protein